MTAFAFFFGLICGGAFVSILLARSYRDELKEREEWEKAARILPRDREALVMTGRTSIEWTWMPGYQGAVWNTTSGCTRVSEGCSRCYAFALHDRRYKANLDAAEAFIATRPKAEALRESVGQTVQATARFISRGDVLPFPTQYDLPFSRVQLLEDRLDVPLRTRKPTCYFVDSMSDLFHEDVPDEFIARVFNAMCAIPLGKDGEPKRGWWDENPHRYLILTKRPERMRRFIEDIGEIIERSLAPDDALPLTVETGGWPLLNVWLGTSVEDQKAADERIPHLLATPAAVRFLSCEPLLATVDLSAWLGEPEGDGTALCGVATRPVSPAAFLSHPSESGIPADEKADARATEIWAAEREAGGNGIRMEGDQLVVSGADAARDRGAHQQSLTDTRARRAGIDWVIVGGESGPQARPMDLAWARSLVQQCRAAGVAVFVKQDSGPRPGMRGRIPDELWLKEWPR